MSQDLTFFEQQDTARLLGVIAALGGEVFVLKAQVERLTRALSAAGLGHFDITLSCGADDVEAQLRLAGCVAGAVHSDL